MMKKTTSDKETKNKMPDKNNQRDNEKDKLDKIEKPLKVSKGKNSFVVSGI
jgi:hypothetical protein